MSPVNSIFVCIKKKSDLIAFKLYNISVHALKLGVDRLSAPILSIWPIIDIGHFKNWFADIFFFTFSFFFMQTNILFTGDIIYWWINNTGETI